MLSQQEKAQDKKVKSFSVRLNSVKERELFEARARELCRSLDGHASFLIREDLKRSGYLNDLSNLEANA